MGRAEELRESLTKDPDPAADSLALDAAAAEGPLGRDSGGRGVASGIIKRGRGDQQWARATGSEEQPFIGLSPSFQPTNDNLDPLGRETVSSVALYIGGLLRARLLNPWTTLQLRDITPRRNFPIVWMHGAI